jgi:hypothetical protein
MRCQLVPVGQNIISRLTVAAHKLNCDFRDRTRHRPFFQSREATQQFGSHGIISFRRLDDSESALAFGPRLTSQRQLDLERSRYGVGNARHASPQFGTEPPPSVPVIVESPKSLAEATASIRVCFTFDSVNSPTYPFHSLSATIGG